MKVFISIIFLVLLIFQGNCQNTEKNKIIIKKSLYLNLQFIGWEGLNGSSVIGFRRKKFEINAGIMFFQGQGGVLRLKFFPGISKHPINFFAFTQLSYFKRKNMNLASFQNFSGFGSKISLTKKLSFINFCGLGILIYNCISVKYISL